MKRAENYRYEPTSRIQNRHRRRFLIPTCDWIIQKKIWKPFSDEILLQKEFLTRQLANQQWLAGVLESAQIAFDSLNNLLHYIKLHYRHFKRHLHLKWPVLHQQLHVIQNTAHRPSTQASYTASRVRPKRKISCAAEQIAATQIAATLTISFPRWRHMSLTSYWGQQWMNLTSYPDVTHLVQIISYS